MNNDGVPLRNLTLGGMVGGKPAENSKFLESFSDVYRFRCMGWIANNERTWG